MTLERLNMVKSQLLSNRVMNEKLIKTFNEIPRELFVPSDKKSIPYQDESLYFDAHRFMLSPLSLARLIESAGIKPHDHALDIGCLTGYSTTILSFLGLSVVGIDEDEEIIDAAKENLFKLGINNAKIAQSNLQDGYGEGGPYDVIFIQGGIETISEKILHQLSEEKGRLVAIKYQPFHSTIMIIRRNGATFHTEYKENVSAPLLPQFGALKKFEF